MRINKSRFVKKYFLFALIWFSLRIYSQDTSNIRPYYFFVGMHKGFYDYHMQGNNITCGIYKRINNFFSWGLKYSLLEGEAFKKFKPLTREPAFYNQEKTNIYYKTGSMKYHKVSLFIEYLPFTSKITPFFDFSFHFGHINQILYTRTVFNYDDNGVSIMSEDEGEKGFAKGLEIGIGLVLLQSNYALFIGGYYGSTFPDNSTFTLFEIKISHKILD